MGREPIEGRLAVWLFATTELFAIFRIVSSVSPESSLPVSRKGISGLHAPTGHLWRCLGRDRFMGSPARRGDVAASRVTRTAGRSPPTRRAAYLTP